MTEEDSASTTLAGRQTLSAQVAEKIYQRIRQQRLASGAILGTEAELADQFGVSRTVVREAVGSLRGLGIVTSRQGRGLCVARGDVIDTMAKAFAPLITDERNWAEVCHLRFVLEIGSLPLVIDLATPRHIEQLRRLAREMLELVEKPEGSQRPVARGVNPREVQFHQLLFDIAGSQLTGRFHRLLIENFYKAFQKGPFDQAPPVEKMRQHVELVEAIAAGDLPRAIDILTAHIDLHLLPDTE